MSINYKQMSMIRNMLNSRFVLLLLIACFINVPAFAQRQDIGMVLMHGKQGAPKSMSELAGELRKKGYVVLTPLMPWGGRAFMTWGSMRRCSKSIVILSCSVRKAQSGCLWQAKAATSPFRPAMLMFRLPQRAKWWAGWNRSSSRTPTELSTAPKSKLTKTGRRNQL